MIRCFCLVSYICCIETHVFDSFGMPSLLLLALDKLNGIGQVLLLKVCIGH